MSNCECEHTAHFPGVTDGPGHHAYNADREDEILRDVKTPYGIFTICRDCHDHDHLSLKGA